MCVKSQNTLFSLFHLSAIIRCASIARHEIHLTDLKTKNSHTKKSTHTHIQMSPVCLLSTPKVSALFHFNSNKLAIEIHSSHAHSSTNTHTHTNWVATYKIEICGYLRNVKKTHTIFVFLFLFCCFCRYKFYFCFHLQISFRRSFAVGRNFVIVILFSFPVPNLPQTRLKTDLLFIYLHIRCCCCCCCCFCCRWILAIRIHILGILQFCTAVVRFH